MAKQKEGELPETIYVYEEKDGDDAYFCAYADREEATPDRGEKRAVGKYRLIEVGELEQKSTYRRK